VTKITEQEQAERLMGPSFGAPASWGHDERVMSDASRAKASLE